MEICFSLCLYFFVRFRQQTTYITIIHIFFFVEINKKKVYLSVYLKKKYADLHRDWISFEKFHILALFL